VTLEAKITSDLQAGQATLANLAENIGASTTATASVLRRMEKEKKVWTMENKNGDTVYKLTYSSKQEKLKEPKTNNVSETP